VDDSLFDETLALSLVELAEDVMSRALVLETDDLCVAHAPDRIMSGRRPSHKNEIKDSIHWGLYLEPSRRLVEVGHARDRIFVGANKSGFWDDKNTPSLHPGLLDGADTAGLKFLGKLDDALRVLGVS